jgi:asparagine synthase (glutamine-hydrolysing)
MCGIVGSFSFKGMAGEERVIIAALMKFMERRGPDDQGMWSGDECTVFGFQRLAILDLTPTGHQPS